MKTTLILASVLLALAPLEARDDVRRNLWTTNSAQHEMRVDPDKGDQRRTDGGVGAKPKMLGPSFFQQLMDEVKKILKGDQRRVRD